MLLKFNIEKFYICRMKKLYLFPLFILFASLGFSQYGLEIGLQVGGSNYLGDIGGKEQARRDFIYDMRLNQTNLAVGAYLRKRLSRTFSVNVAGNYGRISGEDSESIYKPRQGRNLNFRNNIIELALKFEYTLYSDNDFGGRGLYNPNFMIYAFAGAAGYMHNPEAELDGDWYELRPLRTEGQVEEYEKMGFAVPGGLGFYFTFDRKYRIGWQAGYRFTFTDYLDDVSTFYAYDSELGNDPLRIALASQTTPEIIEDVWPGEPSQLYNYIYNSNAENLGQRNQRGIDNNNDGYAFMHVTFGYILQETSRNFRMKKRYSWLKSKRKGKRKSRAKF